MNTSRPSRRKQIAALFSGINNWIRFSIGSINKSNMSKLIYIIRNFGLISLARTVIDKQKDAFRGGENSIPPSTTVMIASPIGTWDGKELRKWAGSNSEKYLLTFMNSETILEFPIPFQPVVSIILLFHNRAEMSLRCLESLASGSSDVPFEVIIVDNASTDETPALLDRIRNAKILRNSSNLGFSVGCNQAADLSTGKYLFFLNNDTEVMPNSIKALVDTLENGTGIGAVGGKLIFPDGTLQEAGSIIWRNGSCTGYGRNDDPFKPEYSFVRDVDFCSGAMLLTPRDLFLSLGKFDTMYATAYYEDADYCMKLWSNGYRVVFQPFAIVIHHEFGSMGRNNSLLLQKLNQEKFKNKWQDTLPGHNALQPGNILISREHKSRSKRILFIDDRIPDYHLGSGYPRTHRMLLMLVEMGYKITFFPMLLQGNVPEISHPLQSLGVEVIYANPGKKIDINTFLSSRPNYYHLAYVSRPHNLRDSIKHFKKHSINTRIIYDAEAIFSLRDIAFSELNGKPLTKSAKKSMILKEVSLLNKADVITSISKKEMEVLTNFGVPSVHLLGYFIEPTPSPATFEERKDILFVGGILGCPSPNEDAVRYFIAQILPLVRQEVDCEFYVVGTNKVKAIWDLASDYVHIVGKVNDLADYYNRCRLFVVPTRYSAGISLKLLEASANGLPAVVTPLTAEQIGWQDNRDFLVGDDQTDFARKVVELYMNRDLFYKIRQNALNRIREDCSLDLFRKNLENILGLGMEIRNGDN